MRIAFYGGRQAGMIVLLTILSLKHEVIYVFAEDIIVERIAQNLKIPLIKKSEINNKKTIDLLKKANIDLLVCSHGKKILTENILKLNCINLHPCLYQYKGSDPITKLIKDKNNLASVGVHRMSHEVDQGEVIVELFKEVELDSVTNVYNQLYSVYSEAIIIALRKLENDN
jgi:methionyl-tRNA formyltransferase